MLRRSNVLDSSKSITNRTSKLSLNQCRICGAPARYAYFGVLSCQSCKMFFRRNGNGGQTSFVCGFNDQCEIKVDNRHICTSCRLAKCFKCGMSTDRFRASRPINSKQKPLVKVHPERLPTLSLLESDKSLLTPTQWTLLSNLYHGFEESQLLSIGQRLIDTHDVVQSTNTNYQSLVQEFIASVYQTTGSYLHSNDDLCQLSSNDRYIMLRNAADNVACIGCGFIMHHRHLFDLAGFANAFATMYSQRSVELQRWAAKFIDPDIVLVKLALSLFALTKNTYSYYPNISTNLTNSLIILEIQNKYVEVTWKYLLYKYGYYETVKRFLNLTSWFLATTMFMFHAQSLRTHVNDINSLVEQTELSLILDDVDQMLETN